MSITDTDVLSSVHCGECGSQDTVSLSQHPDHTSALARLKKIKGQIHGIEKMILERRYCVDLLVQFRAVAAGLNVIETNVLKKHVESCVRDAFASKDNAKIQEKISELVDLVSKRL